MVKTSGNKRTKTHHKTTRNERLVAPNSGSTSNTSYTTANGRFRTRLQRNEGESHRAAHDRHTTATLTDSAFHRKEVHQRWRIDVHENIKKTGDVYAALQAADRKTLELIGNFIYPVRVSLGISINQINNEGVVNNNSWLREANIITLYNQAEAKDFLRRQGNWFFNKLASFHDVKGSSYRVTSVNGIYLDIWDAPYIAGKRYFEFQSLGGKGSGIKIPKNDDNLCLLYAILGGTNPKVFYGEGNNVVKVYSKWRKALSPYFGEQWGYHPLYQKKLSGKYDDLEVFPELEDIFQHNLLVLEKFDTVEDMPRGIYRNNKYDKTIMLLKMMKLEDDGNVIAHYATFTSERAITSLYGEVKNHKCWFCPRSFKTQKEAFSENHDCDPSNPHIEVKMPEEGTIFRFNKFRALIEREVYGVVSVVDVRGDSYDDNQEAKRWKLCNSDAFLVAVEFVCNSDNKYLQKMCKDLSKVIGLLDKDEDPRNVDQDIREFVLTEEELNDEMEVEAIASSSTTITEDRPITRKTSVIIKEAMKYISKTSDKIMKVVVKLRKTDIPKMTPEQKEEHEKATHCVLCKQPGNWKPWKEVDEYIKKKDDNGKWAREPTGEKIMAPDRESKVRHHEHHHDTYVGGAAHNYCNTQAQVKKEMTIVFNKLSKWGASFLNNYDVKTQGRNLSFLKESDEKVRSFKYTRWYDYFNNPSSTYVINFIDSEGFVKHDEGIKEMAEFMRNFVGEEKMVKTNAFLHSKIGDKVNDTKIRMMLFSNSGLFFEKIQMSHIQNNFVPPVEYFKSDLKPLDTSVIEHDRCIAIMNVLGLTFYEYYKMMCRLEATLLADIVENFRQLTWKRHHLEALHFIGTPGLGETSWLYGLHQKGKGVPLISTEKWYKYWEDQKIGGLARVARTYARANLPGCPWYDENKPHKSIRYIDCTSQYPTVACEKLPVGNFQEEDVLYEGDQMWDRLRKVFKAIDSDRGSYVSVKMRLPKFTGEWREHTPAEFCGVESQSPPRGDPG